MAGLLEMVDMLTRRRRAMNSGDASGGRQQQRAEPADPSARLDALEAELQDLRSERQKMRDRLKSRRRTKPGRRKR